MTLKLSIAVFLAVLLSLALVNAQTLVAGKVYGNSFDNQVADATVEVRCRNTILTTKTLGDGTYALRFDNALCSLGDSVQAYATKGTLTGQSSGIIGECGENCEEDYFSIANIMVKNTATNPSRGGGSGIRNEDDVQPILWFICGNDICDNGESEDTCPKDCSLGLEPEENEEKQEPEEIGGAKDNAKEPENNNRSWITGAFTAIGSYMNIPLLSAILAFLIILFVGHKVLQRRKKIRL